MILIDKWGVFCRLVVPLGSTPMNADRLHMVIYRVHCLIPSQNGVLSSWLRYRRATKWICADIHKIFDVKT